MNKRSEARMFYRDILLKALKDMYLFNRFSTGNSFSEVINKLIKINRPLRLLCVSSQLGTTSSRLIRKNEQSPLVQIVHGAALLVCVNC